MSADNLESINAEQLATILLDRKIRVMIKRDTEFNIKTLNERIAKHKENLEKHTLSLQAAKTDVENPRIIEDSIKHYENELKKAQQIVETCLRQLETLRAQLPSNSRVERVNRIKQDIRGEKATIDNLIKSKGMYRQIMNLIEKAETESK